MAADFRTGWVVGLSMSMGFVLGAVWIAPPEVIRLTIASDTAASWTQAVGTLLALAIAIAVPFLLHRQQVQIDNARVERQEREQVLRDRLAARAIAIRISDDVAQIATQVAYVANTNRDYLGPVKRFNLPECLIEDALRLPKSIADSIEDLPRAGPFAIQIQRAVALLKMIPRMAIEARAAPDESRRQPRLTARGFQLTFNKIQRDLALYLDWTIQEFFQGEGSEDLYDPSP